MSGRQVLMAAGIAAAAAAAGVVIARQHARRDRVILGLGGQLADSRACEAVLRERLDLYSAALADEPALAPLLLLAGGDDGQARRRSPSRSASLSVARSS